MINKNILNYIIYGILAFIVIVFLIMVTSSDNKEVEEPKKESTQEVLIIDTPSININVDEIQKINAYVSDNTNAKLTYYSSNIKVATVDASGTVKGIDNGTASIIVSYIGSNGVKLTKQCYVNVAGGIEITSLALPKGELVILKGDNYTLTPEVTPNEYDRSKLSYKVSNSNIISVNKEGVVTALSLGTAKVRVLAEDNIYADISVRVIDESGIPTKIYTMPESITTMNKITMKVDEEKEIVYSVNPTDIDKSLIKFKSNDETIVTLNNSSLKAIKEGTTTVNLSTINGINTDIKVVVKPNIIEVKELKINSGTAVNINVNETSQILYDVLPEDATDRSVSFQSSNTSVATVNNNGLITGVSNGTAVIKVVTNNNMKTKDITVTVTGGTTTTTTTTTTSTSGSSYCKLGKKVGTIDSELLSSPSDTGFDKCKKRSRNLVPYINGVNYGQDGSYVMKVGETLTVNVKLPTMCGKIDTLTRTNHDGQKGWGEYVSQSSTPKVNSNDRSTFVSGATGYTWKITAKKAGCVTVSQTAQFDVTSPGGKRGNMKSMIRLHIKIEE